MNTWDSKLISRINSKLLAINLDLSDDSYVTDLTPSVSKRTSNHSKDYSGQLTSDPNEFKLFAVTIKKISDTCVVLRCVGLNQSLLKSNRRIEVGEYVQIAFSSDSGLKVNLVGLTIGHEMLPYWRIHECV